MPFECDSSTSGLGVHADAAVLLLCSCSTNPDKHKSIAIILDGAGESLTAILDHLGLQADNMTDVGILKTVEKYYSVHCC
jgi:hypothetical protein